jgi:hypothetical protein
LLLHLIQGLRAQAEAPVFLLTTRRLAAADTVTSGSATDSVLASSKRLL